MPRPHYLEAERNLRTITNALKVAADQYLKDARAQEEERTRAQFTQQAIRAQSLHDWIEQEYAI